MQEARTYSVSCSAKVRINISGLACAREKQHACRCPFDM